MRIVRIALSIFLVSPFYLWADGSQEFTISGNVIDCGSASNLANLSPSTMSIWAYRTTNNTSTRILVSKETGFEKEWSVRPSGQLAGFYDYATDASARGGTTSVDIVSPGVWAFTVFRLSSGLVPRIFVGSSSSTVREVSTYAIQNTGVAPVTDDTAGPFRIGNVVSLQGTDHVLNHPHYSAVEWTLADMQDQQYFPHTTGDTRLYLDLGNRVGNTILDHSLFGNDGTVLLSSGSYLVPPTNQEGYPL